MKALIPLDGSERSQHAMQKAMELLPRDGLQVTLLTVQQTGFEAADEDRIAEFEDDQDDEIFPTKASAQGMLDDAAQACRAMGVEVATKVRQGRVVKEILAEAEAHDVLVMHALDRGGLREAIRMSATEKLARKAPCSVLLVADPDSA